MRYLRRRALPRPTPGVYPITRLPTNSILKGGRSFLGLHRMNSGQLSSRLMKRFVSIRTTLQRKAAWLWRARRSVCVVRPTQRHAAWGERAGNRGWQCRTRRSFLRPAGFRPVTDVRFGNVGRNSLRGPGFDVGSEIDLPGAQHRGQEVRDQRRRVPHARGSAWSICSASSRFSSRQIWKPRSCLTGHDL